MEVTVTLDHYKAYKHAKETGWISVCKQCAVQQALRPIFGEKCEVGYSEVWSDDGSHIVAALPLEGRRLIEKFDEAVGRSVLGGNSSKEQELLPGFPYTFDLEPFLG